MKRANIQVYMAALVVLAAFQVRAANVSWISTGTNDWSVGANWSGGSAPVAGDDVIITQNNAGVLLTNLTAFFSSVLLSNNCSLIFSNWDTKLSATAVTIKSSATLTLPAAFSNNAMSNRVWLVCSNLTLASGASINVTGKGYSSPDPAGRGFGPGGGDGIYGDYSGGAGHGGRGGRGSVKGGPTYGALAQPDAPGSAGGSSELGVSGPGGAGGGAVRIDASNGTVTVNGSITANGNAGTPAGGGGGSGGSVWISCNIFTGTNGLIEVKAGNAGGPAFGGGGGGGRIAVIYDTAAQSALPRPRVQFFATPGKGAVIARNPQDADLGTLYFPDNQLFDATWVPHIGRWLVPNFTNLTVTNLTVSNGWLRLPGEGFRLNVTNNLTIIGTNSFTSATLDIGGDNYATNVNTQDRWYRQGLTSGPRLSINGNLVLTNGGRLYVHSGRTNGGGASYGAEVTVDGAMHVVSNAWVYPFSHSTNGASVLFQIGGNLFISSNAGFNADGIGFVGGAATNKLLGSGPGGGNGVWNAYSGGGGYGGAGGTNDPASPNGYGGSSYGSSNAPAHAGSGGGADGQMTIGWGGHGGGFVNILARSGAVTLNGTITANGLVSGTYGGGGSGGGVMIECQSLAGSGTLTANGGAAASPTLCGGGGGGRIAVWYGDVSDLLRQRILAGDMSRVVSELAPQTFSGTNTVNGGDGYGDGTNGTVRFLQLQLSSGTVIRVY